MLWYEKICYEASTVRVGDRVHMLCCYLGKRWVEEKEKVGGLEKFEGFIYP